MAQPVYNIKLMPKQMEFVKSQKKEVIFSGAYGSSKTYSLCAKLLTHALIPNNLVLLTRRTRTSLVNTTLRTLLLGDGNTPPILPNGSYQHQESKSTITMNGGGTIIYRGCDDAFSIRSMNLGAVGVDECAEISEDDYSTLTSRLRGTADNCRQIFAVTNPSSQNHYLYKRILQYPDIVHHITASIDDNKYLPADYVSDQKARYTGVAYKRYIEGLWCNNGSAIYKEFGLNHQIIYDYKDGWNEFVISMDIGFTHPTAILVTGRKDNHLHVFEEVYTNQLTPTDIVNTVKSLIDKYVKIEAILVDPSAKGTIVELEQQNIVVKKANNDVNGGIQRVKELLIKNQLSIAHNCLNTIKEFDLYSYKGATDVPEDKWDDAMDSLRYNVNYYFDTRGSYITPTLFILDETQ